MTIHWSAGLHHDGSVRYVSNPLPAYGETVTLWLRVPNDAPVSAVFLRTIPDGEEHYQAMTVQHQTPGVLWYATDLKMNMPVEPYRFKVMSDEGAYVFNALGAHRADVPDLHDFKLLAGFQSPTWAVESVFYQIFPDRFYNADPSTDVPEGQPVQEPVGVFHTRRMAWSDEPLSYDEAGNVDFFNGDLPGIVAKLPYLQDLGVNALYLNPNFTSPSNHRNNTKDFHEVDPHLGGNDALIALRNATDAIGMRIVLDVTPNHCGDQNPWFVAAQADETAPSADYFVFHEHPHNYESWMGVRTLPKLDYRSEALREAMYRADDSVLRYWLQPPYRIDGWRLDVANMTARLRENQLARAVFPEMREAVKGENPQAYFFGEYFYDATIDLQGEAFDAAMNYAGFNIPMWRWLGGGDVDAWNHRPHADTLPLPAEHTAAQMNAFRATVPWSVAQLQFNQLGSHDTPRILDVCGGDKRLAKLGAVVLMTYLGVPCIYYGDEVGLDGGRDPFNRKPMPWDDPARWDDGLHAFYRQLVTLRRENATLQHGGLQMLHAEGGLLSFQRETADERIVVVGWRGPGTFQGVVPVAHSGIADGTELRDLLSERTLSVENGEIKVGPLDVGDALVLSAGV